MAQTAGGAPAGAGTTSLIMMAVFVVIFYFLLIRPQQKKQKEHQAMLSKITRATKWSLPAASSARSSRSATIS
jgi:preprotein translocase subunit YajC